MPAADKLEIVALGGLGEFGLNLMLYRWDGDCVVVDAGMMFPAGFLPGVDYVIPDLSYLETAGRLCGLILTHAHEDHIGAVPHLLDRHDIPVWGTPYTIELLRRRLAERERSSTPDLRLLPTSPRTVSLGPFSVEAIAVAHSIPQTRLIAIDTPVGRVVHSADFKLDRDPPDGEGTAVQRLAELGDEGVLALLSDSTNAEVAGTTGGEAAVLRGLDAVIAEATGRVLLTTFASNVQRLAGLAQLAERHGRRLALLGASVNLHAEIAQQLELLPVRPGVRVAPEDLHDLPPDRVLAVAAGSQGEPLSAMARIAAGQHRDFSLEPGDTVIHSARIIPGNEKPIGRMINLLLRQGARVLTADDAPVHVSGHAAAAELQQLLALLRPRWFVPIHGEYRQLNAHARLAVASGLDPRRVLQAENGDLIRVDRETFEIAGQASVGRVYMEASGDEVGWDLVRDRRKSSNDGVVVAVVEIDGRGRVAPGYPWVSTRGFTPGVDDEGEMLDRSRQAVAAALEEAPAAERADSRALETRIELHLRRRIRRETQRYPLVIAMVHRG
ncbi:MAG: RNase J family beta-CASP ribonuclease [Acidobacteria bacterium]|nr:RNase J family beta-CASP ribonuclease [Acidobacteriota bacterium]NIM60637.1 RNase J family beta-CASP ribonuclease [Acidobacteriota bacterium]NIO57924.1 RNase J family beta-CASP ribonuclease [Acidobacteriota bacterium]NIQ28927.1 RNase J family beta-CASP ribonuclease [Acidobacteriota bacterium]NIQ83401.1 RNase J family beta-CASP ribonuclease [Acidobacteriota bacterium]